MIFSKSSLSKLRIYALFAVIFLSGCAHDSGGEVQSRTVLKQGVERLRVAVYPIDNMSGAFVRTREIRSSWLEKLKGLGLDIVNDVKVEETMERHRIRYLGGVDSEAAMAMKDEAGADAVLITSLEFYNELYPPKIALISRLTTTGEHPRILWMDSVGLAGDDSPGLLGLGLIRDLPTLQEMALQRLAESLADTLNGNGMSCEGLNAESKFYPKEFYNAFPIDTDKKTAIAVVPFYNDTLRRRGGDILQAHFTRQLACITNVNPIEPGLIREKMLGIRMIMPEGVSIRDVDVLTYILEADFVLSGSLFDYQDPRGGAGTPKIDFSSLMINRGARKVIMLSKSYNKGDDGVYFYDVGRELNANVMAEKMSGSVVDKMTEAKTPATRQFAPHSPHRFHDQLP